MDEEKRHREVEKRERLIQAFLIISGFLVAYTRGDQRLIVLIFSMYLIFTILYYVVLSRTINYRIINLLALFSSWSYSLLIMIFLGSQLTNGFSGRDFCILFVALTAIFTFSLLSPDTSERIFNRFDKFSETQGKPPKLLKVILIIMFRIGEIGVTIIFIIVTICVYSILA